MSCPEPASESSSTPPQAEAPAEGSYTIVEAHQNDMGELMQMLDHSYAKEGLRTPDEDKAHIRHAFFCEEENVIILKAKKSKDETVACLIMRYHKDMKGLRERHKNTVERMINNKILKQPQPGSDKDSSNLVVKEPQPGSDKGSGNLLMECGVYEELAKGPHWRILTTMVTWEDMNGGASLKLMRRGVELADKRKPAHIWALWFDTPEKVGEYRQLGFELNNEYGSMIRKKCVGETVQKK